MTDSWPDAVAEIARRAALAIEVAERIECAIELRSESEFLRGELRAMFAVIGTDQIWRATRLGKWQ